MNKDIIYPLGPWDYVQNLRDDLNRSLIKIKNGLYCNYGILYFSLAHICIGFTSQYLQDRKRKIQLPDIRPDPINF